MSDTQKAAEKALEKLSNQLTCAICLDTYREPKVLTCLHVFCTACLEKLVSQGGTSLTCPNCRRTTQPPRDGVSQLQSAFYINHLFDVRDTLEKVKEAKVDCQQCGDGKATGYCRDCNEFYCQSCIDIHRKVKVLANHAISTVEEVQREALNLVSTTKKATLTCRHHPDKPLEIFCEACEELICHNCTIKTHRDHEYDLVGDCFTKHRDAITASLQPVKQQLDTVNQAVGEMKARARRLPEQVLSIKQKIRDEIDRVHDVLEVRKRELTTHVDQLTKQIEKSIHANLEGYELTQTQFSSCMEYVEESLRTGSQEEILSMKKQVVERMMQTQKEFDPTKFQPEPEKSFDFSHQPLTEACQSFGEVFATQLRPEKCYVTGYGLHGAELYISLNKGIDRNASQILTLHTVDNRGQACADLHAPVTGELVSRGDGSVVRCEVTRKKNNTYQLKYQPRAAGEYDLHIKVYGKHIKDSPFTVRDGEFQSVHVKTIEGVKFPWQLAITEDGEMVVVENSAQRVSLLNREGHKLRSFGHTGTGESKLSNPRGVTICSDNTILVTANHCVKKFTLEGRFVTSVGSQGSGQLQFKYPYAIVFNPVNKKVYVCEQANHRIQVLNSDLTFSSMFGSKGSGPGQFNVPGSIAVDRAGNVYVADCNNDRVQVFSPSGQTLREIKLRGPGMEGLNHPVSVCVDNYNFVYVLEHDASRVSVFNGEGEFVKEFGRGGDKAGEFKSPYAITVDTAGLVYISDTVNNTIQIFKLSCSITSLSS